MFSNFVIISKGLNEDSVPNRSVFIAKSLYYWLHDINKKQVNIDSYSLSMMNNFYFFRKMK
jgi:hypothetical protein